MGRHVFANSRGFAGEYRTSYCSLSTVPVAREGESMERDYWFTSARGFAGLEKPEDVGRIAAQRAVRRLGARKVETQKVPVVFEPRTARTLLDNIFDAVHGGAIYRNESFLAGKLGERVASEKLTVIDDGTIPGPVRHIAVRRRRRADAAHGGDRARRAAELSAEHLHGAQAGAAHHRQCLARPGRETRAWAMAIFISREGSTPPEQLIVGIRDGFYVTELIGFGVNIVTGDYSRGAAGLWIRNGELAFPVSEVTIAGSLPADAA